jgi:hypothetical protein
LALPPRYQLLAERAEYAMQTPGLIVAPLTPFTSDLKVDEAGLARQIDYVVKDCRATMVVAAGVETQEYTYLSLAERKDLIRHTIELTDNRVPVMVGIPAGEPYPPYSPLSRDEMTAMAATLKATVLGPRFKAAAA